MSGDSLELRNYAKEIAPYAGWVNGVAVSATALAAAIDLSTYGYPQTGASGGNAPDPGLLSDVLAPLQSTSNINLTGLLGKQVRFTAFTATIWVVFNGTAANIIGANVPVIPTGGGNVTGLAVPFPIAPGQSFKWWISTNTRYMNAIASGAGYLMINPASTGA